MIEYFYNVLKSLNLFFKQDSSDKDAGDPLLEVKVEPQERPVDVGSLETKAPKTPTTSSSSDSDDNEGLPGQRRDSKDKDSSTTSTSSDHVKPMPLIDPHVRSQRFN